jgi:hypothetical protein
MPWTVNLQLPYQPDSCVFFKELRETLAVWTPSQRRISADAPAPIGKIAPIRARPK